MLTRATRRSAVWPVLAVALAVAAPTLADEQPSTIGAMLTAVTDNAPATPSDMHALQNKLQSDWVGKTVTVNAGRVIQVVTEGGGVKLISFPPDETAGRFSVRHALCHATLVEADEAAGKKLSPGNDSYVVTGTVASLSAQFTDPPAEDGQPTVRLHLTLKDAKIVSTTIAPKRKKAVATKPAAE